jgi:hypothetical protein
MTQPRVGTSLSWPRDRKIGFSRSRPSQLWLSKPKSK